MARVTRTFRQETTGNEWAISVDEHGDVTVEDYSGDIVVVVAEVLAQFDDLRPKMLLLARDSE